MCALQMGKLSPEKSIPDAVLNGAKGLAILTVFKVGLMVTYKVGTGLVVARNSDDTWSAPSAIASCGLGWGAQVCFYQNKQLAKLLHLLQVRLGCREVSNVRS